MATQSTAQLTVERVRSCRIPDRCARALGSIECPRRGEHGWLDIGRRTVEEYESNVGNARFERSDQVVVSRIAPVRWRTVRHRRVRGLTYHRNPCAGIVDLPGRGAKRGGGEGVFGCCRRKSRESLGSSPGNRRARVSPLANRLPTRRSCCLRGYREGIDLRNRKHR